MAGMTERERAILKMSRLSATLYTECRDTLHQARLPNSTSRTQVAKHPPSKRWDTFSRGNLTGPGECHWGLIHHTHINLTHCTLMNTHAQNYKHNSHSPHTHSTHIPHGHTIPYIHHPPCSHTLGTGSTPTLTHDETGTNVMHTWTICIVTTHVLYILDASTPPKPNTDTRNTCKPTPVPWVYPVTQGPWHSPSPLVSE